MTLKVGEVGKIFRVAAGFDMSANTELTLTFTLPDGTEVIKIKADGIVLGTGVTDPDLGVLAANEYVEYPIEAGFIRTAGTWKVSLTYTNTSPTPDDIFIGNCVNFTVDKAAC